MEEHVYSILALEGIIEREEKPYNSSVDLMMDTTLVARSMSYYTHTVKLHETCLTQLWDVQKVQIIYSKWDNGLLTGDKGG